MPNNATDAEVICGWMEPQPSYAWWKWEHGAWAPGNLSLDRLHLVEAKLTDPMWRVYWGILEEAWAMSESALAREWYAVHASAEVKLAALAAVIREAKGNR